MYIKNRGYLLAILLLIIGQNALAQFNEALSGKILDQDDAAVPFATVTIGELVTKSADDGSFYFTTIPAGSHSLVITAVGYQRFEEHIH